MSDQTIHCKNCDHPLEEAYKYCPECGQKAKDELTISVLFSNTISNYFSVDARFFASFLPLLFRPGYLPRKFVEGKRLKYLHPAQFYLFISVVFFFLLSFVTRDQQDAFDKTIRGSFDGSDQIDSTDMTAFDSLKMDKVFNVSKELEFGDSLDLFTQAEMDTIIENVSDSSGINILRGKNNLDSLIDADAPLDEKLKALGYKEGSAKWKKKMYTQMLKIYEKRGGGLLTAFYDTIPIAMFFLLPIYALLLKLLFYKKGHFAHHLVFSFYFFSFLFTVFSILLLADLIYPFPNWIDWLIVLGTGIYLLLAIKRFYEVRLTEAFLRTTVVSFLYLLFVVPTSIVILSVVSFLIY